MTGNSLPAGTKRWIEADPDAEETVRSAFNKSPRRPHICETNSIITGRSTSASKSWHCKSSVSVMIVGLEFFKISNSYCCC